MKKTIFIIGLFVILLTSPTLFAYPSLKESPLDFSSFQMADGTFVGGLGKGHWGNGFHIDETKAYLNGVYSDFGFIKLTGDITNPNNKKIGEIRIYLISNIIFGYTANMQDHRTPIIVILRENRNDQFVGQVLFSSFKSSPHIWGYFIPNL
jgi:hypothetical protein